MEDFLDEFPEARPVHRTDVGGSLRKGAKLFVGRLFTIHASAPPDAAEFNFNLVSGGPDGNVALHVSCRFHEGCVVRNSRIDGSWEREEREGGFPLSPGADFEMMVTAEEGRFRIAFNGSHFAEFAHRLAPVLVDTVTIGGDINIASYKETLAPHAFGLFGGPLQPIQSDGLRQCFEVPKGMKAGRKIHIGAVPLGDVFIADFKTDILAEEDIGLHISCRVPEGVVVFNSRMDGEWQEEVRVANMPFAPGEHFDLLIAASESGFSIAMNGATDVINFFPFRHIKEKKLKGLVIHGSVKVNFVTSIRQH